MFQNMLTNNPEPSYVHQTNLMGAPPGCASLRGVQRRAAGDGAGHGRHHR